MVPLTSLWLPILLSAVFVFIASSIIHMVLGYHRADFTRLPDEDGVMTALRRFALPPGDYMMPRPGGPNAMKDPAFLEKMKQGPVGTFTITKGGSINMGPQLAQWFLYCLFVSLFAGYIASRGIGPGAEYLRVSQMASSTAFAAYALGHWQGAIWYKRSVGMTIRNTIDGIIYGFITGGTLRMVVATIGRIGVVGALAIAGAAPVATQDTFTSDFHLEKSDLSSTGRNPYLRLEPGSTLTLADGAGQLVVGVLNDTKMVDGVETRVVEERETKHGELIEVSRNYFAISRRTNSVFYFGEDVDIYKAGKVVSHEGAWMAGAGGARAGLMMPGLPLLRARFYQEWAPRVAMDRAEILSLTDARRTPAGSFTDVMKVEETTPLEPGVREYKYYARDVGLIQDGSMVLVKAGRQ